MQDLAFGHAEPREGHMGPLLNSVKDGFPILKHISCTTELDVTYQLARSALNRTMSLIKILNITGCILMHSNHFNVYSDGNLNWKNAATVVSAELVELLYSLQKWNCNAGCK